MALDLSKPLRLKRGGEIVKVLESDSCGKLFFAYQLSTDAASAFQRWCVDAVPLTQINDHLENVPETRELDCWVAFDATPDAQGCIGSLWTTEHVAKNLAASFSDGACFRLQRTYEVGEGLS